MEDYILESRMVLPSVERNDGTSRILSRIFMGFVDVVVTAMKL